MDNRIDSIRKRKGMSYETIAQEAGLTKVYIHSLAKGKRKNPSLDAMKNISMALGEPINTVFALNKIDVICPASTNIK
jgi:transcriptional regulator with XRE-family HTH domain